MLDDILIPFIVVGLAELGDKTQLSILMLASKTKKHLSLLLGVMFAFLIVDGIAILAGGWLMDIAPQNLIKTFSGIIFIVFGILVFREKETEEKESHRFKKPFYSGFTLTFVAEWGDKTQIASGLFATRYNGLMVLIGVIMALTLLSIMAIYLGRFLSTKVRGDHITKVSGMVFILIGMSFLFL
jgi:putative Ca2+/H+ antiporter (TMEM165/GDT1 family)